jgi:hypothetical protein
VVGLQRRAHGINHAIVVSQRTVIDASQIQKPVTATHTPARTPQVTDVSMSWSGTPSAPPVSETESNAAAPLAILNGTEVKINVKPSKAVGEGDSGDTRDQTGFLKNATALWNIIQPYLKIFSNPAIAISKGYVWEMLQCEKVRELEWRALFGPNGQGFTDSRIYDLTAMLIQLTGPEAATPCARCQKGSGPFASCVRLPENAPSHLHANIRSCASCYYKGCQSQCSFWSKLQSVAMLTPLEVAAQKPLKLLWLEYLNAGESPKPSKIVKLRLPQDASGSSFLSASTSSPVIAPQASENAKAMTAFRPTMASAREPRNIPHQPDYREIPPSTIDRHGRDRRPEKRVKGFSHQFPGPSKVETELEAEMEDWEIAPGRVRDESSQQPKSECGAISIRTVGSSK